MASEPKMQPVTDSVAKINNEVAIGEDLGFQRRWWHFERGMWIVFALIIGLDLAGAFGRGPLANAEMHSPERALAVIYERIQRSGTPSMMTVTLDGASLRDGYAEITLSDSAVSALGLRRVIPAPEKTSIGSAGLTYRFPATQRPAIVRFEFEPVSAGVYGLAVAVPNGASLQAKVVVVP